MFRNIKLEKRSNKIAALAAALSNTIRRLRCASPPVIHEGVPAGLGIENSTEILPNMVVYLILTSLLPQKF
jgi:hypothetical protein